MFKGIPGMSLPSDMPNAEFASKYVHLPMFENPLPDSLQTHGQVQIYPIECKGQAILNKGSTFYLKQAV